jgi:CheY-like chemotaxis protein
MAGGDGVSLLRDIRRDPELKSRQFVFLSGTTDWGSLRNSVEERADDFLTKPVSFQALLSCMKVRFSCASISWRAEGQILGPDPLLDAA